MHKPKREPERAIQIGLMCQKRKNTMKNYCTLKEC